MRALPLPHDEIHVWHCKLDGGDGECGHDHAAFFSPEEEAQCKRLRFAIDRRHYRQARWARRVILASYADCRPDELQFTCAPSGKPFVRAMSVSFPLMFSASRSERLALIAVAGEREIGVDVERVRDRRVWAPIAGNMLSQTEASALSRLPEPIASDQFASIWSRKEALLKALGWGLGRGLDAVPAATAPSRAGEPLVQTIVANGRSWSVHQLPMERGYAAAIACAGEVRRVRSFFYGGAGASSLAEHAPALTPDPFLQ